MTGVAAAFLFFFLFLPLITTPEKLLIGSQALSFFLFFSFFFITGEFSIKGTFLLILVHL